MPSAYKRACARASAAAAGFAVDPTSRDAERRLVDALNAAVRVFMGDPDATAFSSDAVERVRRDVLVHFGDGVSARIRPKIEQRFGAEVAEAVERAIVDGIAALLRAPLTGEAGEAGQ